MAYTEFRKSCGDFEIIIPAVDFSKLTPKNAARVANTLHDYKSGWVCLYLEHTHKLYGAAECIANAFGQAGYYMGVCLEDIIYKQHPRFEISFDPYNPPGNVLRQEWCKHMAAEIKREFGL